MKLKVFFWLIQRAGFLLLFSILVAQPLTAFSQGTAFTYQGRLGQNGSPYNGPAEMQFTLFGVPSGSAPLATNNPATASVDVSNGLFTIALDFGVGAFNGDARWLEIAVRTNGAGAFTTLAPRQQISAAPYAITAREITGNVAAQQLTGIIQPANIGAGSITSVMIAPGSIHSNLLAPGSVHSNALVIGSIHSNHLAVGSIHSNHLAAGSVHSNALAFGVIHSNHLAAGSVHSNALVFGSVTASALAAGSIHSNHLAVGSVHSNALVTGSIHSNHLATGSIHSNALAFGSVTATALAAGSIHSNHLSAGSVHSNALALGSVTATALAAGSIHSNHLAVGSVDSSALVIGSIHSNHLADGAVTLDSLNTALSGSFPKTIAHPNSAFFNYFGRAVAAVGTDKVIAGAHNDSTGGDNGGAAYLLNINGTLLQTFLRPPWQNQAHFGISVAAVGSENVLIGADADDIGALDAGAAYLFSVNGPLITTFTNPTPAVSDFFGYALAAVGTDKVLIGAHGDHFGANVGGAAYLFSTNRTLLTTFTNPTPSSGDRFGIAVAAVGTDHVLIGADRDDQGATDAGVAHLFHISGALVITLTNPTPALNEAFGSALASVDLSQVVIGAPGESSGGGAVYLFSTNGALLTTFTNPTPASGDQFGTNVAVMGGSRVLIGAAADDAGATDGGVAHMFSLDGTLLTTFNNPTPATGDLFGAAVAAVGADKIFIGAPQDDVPASDSGAAYLFTLNSYVPGLVLDPTFNTWTKSGSDTFYNGGNVGIGTTTPQAPLQVSGNNSQLRLHDTGRGNYWNIYTENHPNQAISGNLLFVPGPGGVYSFIQKSTGNYFSGSDERLKTDIHSLSSVLDRLLQLRPVSYRFKTAPPSSPPTIGLIAQEVELLFPEVVTDHDDLKALSYSELVPVTVGAIQELNQKLEEKLQKKETEMTQLKRELAELKKLVETLAQKSEGGAR